MFGCAFITNETTETFEWVLESFKKSMAGAEPKTIFTDQDQVMSNAITKAAEIFTLNIFKDFEEEYDTSMRSYIRDVSNEMTVGLKIFEVSLHEVFKHSHSVFYNDRLKEFACSCLCFNETGIICYHILRVMHMHNVFIIPPRYIMKRWTKAAKSSNWEDREGSVQEVGEENTMLNTSWRHTIARNFYNLVCICQTNTDVKKVCDESLDKMYQAVKKAFQSDEEKIKEINEEEERRKTVPDPLQPKTKGRPPGRNKRIRGHFEKRKTTTRHVNEFGTKLQIHN
ncbi:protein FAR-RED IMPAIRED RESPONSE 1-like [Chenopodium quinoa]|uniref:protein FAR-RED IMPAIRED RESPONSE 1-like n=1 Tax=Chenopodium quinoa TaxID=63459 RepID=UPI000B776372|nr:protein FAR-RED IMPAIRED RESPONSE 1-like [Chenopodium quinoa]